MTSIEMSKEQAIALKKKLFQADSDKVWLVGCGECEHMAVVRLNDRHGACVRPNWCSYCGGKTIGVVLSGYGDEKKSGKLVEDV